MAMAAAREICFGPFIVRHEFVRHFEGMKSTGLGLEFTTSERLVSPLYEQADRSMVTSYSSGIGKFFIHQDYLPCDLPSVGYFRRRMTDGLLIPLDEVLLAVHRQFSSSRSPSLAIRELRELLDPSNPERAPVENLLNESIARAGFRTTVRSHYGRTISIHVEWVPPCDAGRLSRCSVSMGFIEFKPQPDRTLGKGKWIKPRVDLLGLVFRSELAKISTGSPFEYLSPEGAKQLVEEFAWKPISLLKRKELQEAKIDFIRKHPVMHQDLSGLAKAMIEVGLFSEGTDRSRVKRYAMKALKELGLGLS